MGPNFDKWTETDVTRSKEDDRERLRATEHADLGGIHDRTGPAPPASRIVFDALAASLIRSGSDRSRERQEQYRQIKLGGPTVRPSVRSSRLLKLS